MYENNHLDEKFRIWLGFYNYEFTTEIRQINTDSKFKSQNLITICFNLSYLCRTITFQNFNEGENYEHA